MEPISSLITTYRDRPSCQPSHVTDQTPADAARLGLPIYVMCITALAARSRFRIPIDTLSGDYRLNPLTSSPFNFLAQPNPGNQGQEPLQLPTNYPVHHDSNLSDGLSFTLHLKAQLSTSMIRQGAEP